MPRMSKTERTARDGLMKNLIYLMQENWIPDTIAEEIPAAWHTLEQDVECAEPRQKVTLYLDRSVVKFYRSMGQGYQARINRLLATYAQMHLAREIKLEEALKERLGYQTKEASEMPEGYDEFLKVARGEDNRK